jgi:hypothetical protein
VIIDASFHLNVATGLKPPCKRGFGGLVVYSCLNPGDFFDIISVITPLGVQILVVMFGDKTETTPEELNVFFLDSSNAFSIIRRT